MTPQELDRLKTKVEAAQRIAYYIAADMYSDGDEAERAIQTLNKFADIDLNKPITPHIKAIGSINEEMVALRFDKTKVGAEFAADMELRKATDTIAEGTKALSAILAHALQEKIINNRNTVIAEVRRAEECAKRHAAEKPKIRRAIIGIALVAGTALSVHKCAANTEARRNGVEACR